MDFADTVPSKAPSAWLDMDALDYNIHQVNQKTQAVNLRLATKSIRSIDVLNYHRHLESLTSQNTLLRYLILMFVSQRLMIFY